ncbi:hypothetical protein [Flavobacterium daejeonense]|uniref:hypothetical protein n=1 Tax=Flavobacterium daejeonense TaxID=350893 RepID=UPI00047C46E0|nr:hypothetical protein [Flavobacterium daejeonense]
MRNLFLIFFLITTSLIQAQMADCTDPLAKNFNPKATLNDGSCEYKKVKTKAESTQKLSDTLRETSGLIAFDNLLWTHNDDHDITIYGLDTLGAIKKKIKLEKVTNTDWEEITQDSNSLYIGDFGNNYQGNRRDLHILRIEKKSFLTNTPIIDTIAFSYADQTDFSIQKPNTTNFDCEAFVVTKDSIYLFTKQWKSNKTGIYTIPKQTGNHIAQLKQTIDTKGLITAATYLESKKLITLCGYSKHGKPFLYLLYDFKNNNFSSGNKRRINLQFSFHQIEGISTTDGLHYYLTNEALILKPILNVQQQMHYIDLSSILQSYLHN